MAGVNKVIIIGSIGKDPEVRYMPNGRAWASISVATSEKWRDKQSGEVKEKTEWHDISIFGKLAEIAGEYLTKGSQVYIEGQLETRKWQDKTTGQDRYKTGVVVKGFNGVMQMLGGGKQGGNGQQQQQQQQGSWGQPQQPQQQYQHQQQPMQTQGENFADDDIPF